ncbi:MAG: hypothetical protein DRR04_13265 [Gammaproteobacteria bacterium]|nr:MAG: hypothetical protein DRR04_13265 [Gammaproteobacteria bacterium]
MANDKSKLRQELRKIEKSRWAHVQKILQEGGPMRPGSLVTVLRKCGKPNCRCATGERHPAKYLSIKEGGKTRMVYVPAAAEVMVAEETKRYRGLRQERATLVKLAQRSLELIDELQKVFETSEPIKPVGRAQRSATPRGAIKVKPKTKRRGS